jgi:hypothetical protein
MLSVHSLELALVEAVFGVCFTIINMHYTITYFEELPFPKKEEASEKSSNTSDRDHTTTDDP